MKLTGTTLATIIVLLGSIVTSSGVRAEDEHQILIRLVHDPTRATGSHGELEAIPDPLVLERDRPSATTWRFDAEHRSFSTLEVSFEEGAPFSRSAGSGQADGTEVSLGQLKDPVDAGRFPYTVRLLDASGTEITLGHGTIQIQETMRIPPLAILIACGIGVIFLISNYVERKPLTRSYEPEPH
jgi:hypothetical protein